MDFKISFATIVLTFMLITFSLTAVHAQEKVENLYFSLKVPETWTYAEYSNTAMASFMGRGPVNDVQSAPGEFGDLLVDDEDSSTGIIDRLESGGVFSEFTQDTDYSLKNAPLNAYVKYIVNQQSESWNVTSMDNGTIAKQDSVKISSNGTSEYANLKKIEYLVFGDKEPYRLQYIANIKDYDKYLPEFEQMVKSFRFVG